MPSSMTGFASAELTRDSYHLAWEIRSVNHRFLDLSLRLPDELRKLEPRCKEAVGAVLRRGKLDLSFRVAPVGGLDSAVVVNEPAVLKLLALQAVVLQRCPEANPLDVAAILRWPGVLEEPALLPDDVEVETMELLSSALAALVASRAREGERLAELLRQRCDAIVALVGEVRPKLANAESQYRAKLLERLERFGVTAEPERLEQELALIAQRFDVTEEIDRLSSHVEEIRDTLRKDEAIGRRLDFIIQELNREANTFASKVQDEALTRAAVELKVLIEQMREQVQNLE